MSTRIVEAPSQVLQLVLDQAVLPRLVQIQEELNRPLSVMVSQGVAPERTVQRLDTPDPPPGASVTGTARVSFRMNYGGDRYLFRTEVIFPRTLSPDTGFSGFNAHGAVELLADGYRLDAPHWTVQYNVWEFGEWP